MLLSLRNFVFTSFIIFEKLEESQAKEEYQKNANGFIIMAKLSPGVGFLSIVLPQGRNFAKIFCPGAGILTTLKKFPGGQPRGGILVLGID